MQPGHVFRPLFVGGGEAGPADNRQPGASVPDASGFPGGGGSAPPGPGASGLAAAPSVMYPEVAVFSQFDQILPHMALLQPLQALQAPPGPGGGGGDEGAPVGRAGAARPADGRGTSDYASRHQAAEQRRRTRINERLDRLRKVVPHAERANTAAFLEQVLTYIEALKKQVVDLEGRLDRLGGRKGGDDKDDAAQQSGESELGARRGSGSVPEPLAPDITEGEGAVGGGGGLAGGAACTD
ncbi:unnamed protein product, partial [Ostreobium quekettii]